MQAFFWPNHAVRSGEVLGQVDRALPSLEPAFVDIGRDVVGRETYDWVLGYVRVLSHQLSSNVEQFSTGKTDCTAILRRDVYETVRNAGRKSKKLLQPSQSDRNSQFESNFCKRAGRLLLLREQFESQDLQDVDMIN